MAPGESVSAVSIDEAWSDLRHHLDWTQGEGTLVLIATESRAQAESLRERSSLWAQRTGEPWRRAPADDSAASWLRRHLPQRGILWAELWDDAARLTALHVLNEVRIRFAQPGGGCLVLCGPIRLLEEAAHEAADLWSIRSFAHAVRGVVPTHTEMAPERTESPPLLDSDYRSVWRVTLLPEIRDERAAAVLRDVDRARMLLSSDPVRARRLLDGSKNADSELARVLFGLVRAEIGGIFDDVVAVEANLSSTLKHMADFPSDFRVQVVDAVLSIGERFGAQDATVVAAEKGLDAAHVSMGSSGIPGVRLNLSAVLRKVGRVAEAHGDWDVAGRAYEDLLAIFRKFAGMLGTVQSRWDLSVSLDNVGRVAEARGDWGAAGRAYEESLDIARDLADKLGTPGSRRDLSVSLNNVGRLAQTRGDWDTAERAYEESLDLARDLADKLGTPGSRWDLSVSLNNVGRLAEVRADWDTAERAYEELLGIAREPADKLGTPGSRWDLSVSLDNVGRVAEARGDWGAAGRAYEESLGIARELADSLGTPESLRDLVISLGNLAGVVERLGDAERAESLSAERDRIAKILDSGSSET